MKEAVYLRRGAKVAPQAKSAIVRVKSTGSPTQKVGFSQDSYSVLKGDADKLIADLLASPFYEAVYVIGYHEAVDKAASFKRQSLMQ